MSTELTRKLLWWWECAKELLSPTRYYVGGIEVITWDKDKIIFAPSHYGELYPLYMKGTYQELKDNKGNTIALVLIASMELNIAHLRDLRYE